jgi:tRNA(Arg) A34 adenosine deaminase TadA
MPDWLDEFLESAPKHDFSSPEGRMAFAIALSDWNVKRKTGGPFGAAVFDRKSSTLLSCGVNRVEPECSAIAHAEVMALALAQKSLKCHDLGPFGLELATSSQPCLMCFGAAIWSGVGSILIGARKEDVEGIAGFDEGPLPETWVLELERRGVSITRDILREEASAVLRAYRESGAAIYNSSANPLGNLSGSQGR